MKILALGAHYDDIEIGVVGTLAQHLKHGHEIIYAITNSDEEATGTPHSRLNEQLESLKLLDKTLKTSANFHTFQKKDDIEEIIKALDYLKFNVLFIPWEFDTHQAHRNASYIGQAVGRKRNITTYFYSSGSTYDFYPTTFNPIDFNFKKKILNCFKSQIKCRAINIDIIEKRESYWASTISNEVSHAEGFIARKSIYSFGRY